MTQLKRHKAYKNPENGPSKGYHKTSGTDGFTHTNGEIAFSDNIEVWLYGKRKGKKQNPNLF